MVQQQLHSLSDWNWNISLFSRWINHLIISGWILKQYEPDEFTFGYWIIFQWIRYCNLLTEPCWLYNVIVKTCINLYIICRHQSEKSYGSWGFPYLELLPLQLSWPSQSSQSTPSGSSVRISSTSSSFPSCCASYTYPIQTHTGLSSASFWGPSSGCPEASPRSKFRHW